MSAKKKNLKKKDKPKKKGFSATTQDAKVDKPKPKSKKTKAKISKKEREALKEAVKESSIDTTLDTSREWSKRFESTSRRLDSQPQRKVGIGSVFGHARDKEKKCFAIGGTLTDLINGLKGQTYALAGTGYHPDGTPIERVKGRNWEEQYTQMLMYLATAEALGCTYQGHFSSLKNLKSQTETSSALIDEMATDLKNMTLNKSSFGSRHIKKLEKIDSQIKNIALRVQLANLQWDFRNMDKAKEDYERYLGMMSAQRTQFDKIVEKVRSVKGADRKLMLDGKKVDGKSLTDDQKELLNLVPFFYPPSKSEIKALEDLTRTREKERDTMFSLIDERRAIIASELPSGVSMSKAATKVSAALDTVSEQIFGDMDKEKGVMRGLIAESMGAYVNDSIKFEDRLEQLFKTEKGEFAKILEILGRLRLARESLERDTATSIFEDKRLRKSISEGKQRDVIELLSKEFAVGADREKFKSTFLKTHGELQARAREELDADQAKKFFEQSKAYGNMYQFLYAPSSAAAPDRESIIQVTPSKSPEQIFIEEEEEAVEEEPTKLDQFDWRRKAKRTK